MSLQLCGMRAAKSINLGISYIVALKFEDPCWASKTLHNFGTGKLQYTRALSQEQHHFCFIPAEHL